MVFVSVARILKLKLFAKGLRFLYMLTQHELNVSSVDILKLRSEVSLNARLLSEHSEMLRLHVGGRRPMANQIFHCFQKSRNRKSHHSQQHSVKSSIFPAFAVNRSGGINGILIFLGVMTPNVSLLRPTQYCRFSIQSAQYPPAFLHLKAALCKIWRPLWWKCVPAHSMQNIIL